MKTILRRLKALSLPLFSVLTAPLMLAQTTPSENSSGAISVDRSVHYAQTGDGQITAQQTPFNFTFHVRGGSETLKTDWGPKFYKPGSAGVVQSGSSSATNTGTLNFPDAPNNGSDFMFVHEFDTDSAMEAFYPIAPTDGGQYGVKFLGSNPPAAEFTDGLVYAAGTTYPTDVPQVTSVDNEAEWAGGKLHIKADGLTTLTFNTFSEYSSTTYGSMIAIGIYDAATGTVVDGASKTSYYLPVGDSTENPDPIVQPAITEISLDGSWLVPGRTYTIELQYTIIAGRPEEATLAGVEFQGVSSYRRVTTISLVAGNPTAAPSDFNGDGQSDILWQNTANGNVYMWLMNGTSYSSYHYVTTMTSEWRAAGTGDFNGDGKADIVWHNTVNGNTYIWYMDGPAYTSYEYVTTMAAPWQLATVGDFNGDGRADIVWRNTANGNTYIWLMNGASYTSYGFLTTLGSEWRVAGTGDFNHDGKSDLLWQNTTTGASYIWMMDGLTYTSYSPLATMTTDWLLVGNGDFNADGKGDIIWRNTVNGNIYIWLMDGTDYTSYEFLTNMTLDWRIAN